LLIFVKDFTFQVYQFVVEGLDSDVGERNFLFVLSMLYCIF